MINLDGKNALVCGASKGIGFASAKAFNQSGAYVTLVSSNESNLVMALENLPYPENADYIIANFDEYKDAEIIIQQHIEKFGNYHILLNNSGGPPPGMIVNSEIENFQNAINRHLFASHSITKLILPFMKEVKFGRIINIISISVKQPVKNLGVSNTIRGAMNSWSKTLSEEIAKYGITVNNILPGYTETERLKSLFTNISKQKNIPYEDVKLKIEEEIPLKRLGKPQEIANAALFLASDLAGYITGINLPVDGGFIRGF